MEFLPAPYLPQNDPMETHWRNFSFGLCQIGGDFARNQGYTGNLTDLQRLEVNLEEGCRILGGLLERYQQREEEALAAWNDFRSYLLADKVLRKVPLYEDFLKRDPQTLSEPHTSLDGEPTPQPAR